MINSLFKRLPASTADALQSGELVELESIDVEELAKALSSAKGDLEVTHASLQKLYEEASYVYDRLDHMEKTMLDKHKSIDSSKAENDDSGETGGSTGAGGVAVKKVLSGFGEGKIDARINKIKEAKGLTKDLLTCIEELSLKVKNTSALTSTPSMRA